MKTKEIKNPGAPKTPTKIIEGEIFIIPNHPATKSEIGWNEPYQWEAWKKSRMASFENLGLEIEDIMIYTWTTNKDVDNFHCHFDSFAEKILGKENLPERSTGYEYWDYRKQNIFPEELPLSVVKDLEEGDTLVLTTLGGIQFSLKVSQLNHRYGTFGRFEEVLKKLCNTVELETVKA